MYQTKYDSSIQARLKERKAAWGKHEENLENLIRWGIPALDKRLVGINTFTGELNLIIGEEKKRKTTLMINVLVNILTAPKPKEKPAVSIDTLESGMQPDRYTDQIISNLAGRYLMANGHVPVTHGNCPVCGSTCKELAITPEFLMFLPRSQEQLKAIDFAYDTMQSWKLDIWGANLSEGNTRSLNEALGKMTNEARWIWMSEEKGTDIFIIDHVQQYRFETLDVTDYEKLMRAVTAMSSFVASNKKVVFMLSQISLTSLRESRAGGTAKASGGKKPHEEANSILRTTYEDGSGVLGIALDGSRKSAGGFYHELSIDDVSGAIVPREEELEMYWSTPKEESYGF